MEELKKQILELLKTAKNGLDREGLKKSLNLTASAEIVELGKTLDQMEDDDELIRTANNRYKTLEQAGYVKGILKINKRGTGFVDRPDQPSILIRVPDQKDALNGDTILTKPIPDLNPETGEISYTGTVIRVLKRAHTHVIGTYVDTVYGLRFLPDDIHLQSVRMEITAPSGFRPVPGLKVMMQVVEFGSPLQLEVSKTLGNKDDPGVDILSVLLDYDITMEFPEDAMKQAEAIPQEVQPSEMEGRVNLTGDTIVTIDGNDSKDFDDAVGVQENSEGWLLKVSIADVSHYVTEGSPLDREAERRGCSTYVTDRVVPMLPHILSNGICSLNPHVVRLTNTCEMQIGKDGSVKSYKLYPSFMRSAERMTYDHVNEILQGNEERKAQYAHLGNLFETLAACADAIRAHRKQKGAIDFDTTESEILCDEKGHPYEIRPKHHGHAEEMIEDCMIAANVCVADFMHTHEFPCVYRIHEEPQKKKLQDFTKLSYLLGVPFSSKNLSPKNIQQYLSGCRDSEEYPVLSQQLLRTMAKARYDSVCAGHFGLAEPEYLHFTSPIRRYPDLIVHRMLRKYDYEHFQGNPSADQKKMQAYSESSSERERASQSAEFDCDDMKKAEYMMDHIGETAEGIITTVTNFGFFVQLSNTVEGMVRVNAMSDDFYHFDEKKMCLRGERTRTEYRVGQTVRIKVLGASKDAKTVDFGLQNMKTARKPAPVSAGRKYSTRSRAARKSEQVEEPYSSYDYGKHFRYGRDARRKQNGRKKYR